MPAAPEFPAEPLLPPVAPALDDPVAPDPVDVLPVDPEVPFALEPLAEPLAPVFAAFPAGAVALAPVEVPEELPELPPTAPLVDWLPLAPVLLLVPDLGLCTPFALEPLPALPTGPLAGNPVPGSIGPVAPTPTFPRPEGALPLFPVGLPPGV